MESLIPKISRSATFVRYRTPHTFSLRELLMNDHYIVVVYLIVDDLLKAMHYQTAVRTGCSDAYRGEIEVVNT